jgi:hypothetical protein
MSAGETLQAAALAAVRHVPGLSGAFPGEPIQAAYPHAIVAAELEIDWSHKSGSGREVRLVLILRDEGERAERLRTIGGAAEAAVQSIDTVEGWQIVNLQFLRSRMVREARGRWAMVTEYRARMLALLRDGTSTSSSTASRSISSG